MTALEVIAQAESEAVYRQAEQRLRADARTAMKAGAHGDGLALLEMAHHAGMEFVRNHIGSQPDRWERPGTVLG